MSFPELRISCRLDDEWTGEIVAAVKSGAFSAEGSAWFDRTRVNETFVAQLRSFPFDSINPPTLEGGFWDWKEDGRQLHLRIVIKPYDARGALLVYVELASQFSGRRGDDPYDRAKVHFLAEYAAMDVFAEHLEQVLSGQRETAILRGSGG